MEDDSSGVRPRPSMGYREKGEKFNYIFVISQSSSRNKNLNNFLIIHFI